MSPTAPALSAEPLAGTADLVELRAEWSALCDQCPGTTPFQRPEWLLPWSRAFPPHDPWILTVRQDESLVGLIPLFLWQNGAERTLSPFGAGLSDYLDAVIAPGAENEVMAALFTWLESRRGTWDACDFEQLRPGSPLLTAPAPRGWREEVVPAIPCQIVDLPKTVEELQGRVSSRLLSNLRKYRRTLEKQGTVEIQSADSSSREALLDLVLDLHTARWQERGEAGMMADPKVRAFHHAVAAGLAARGALLLDALCLDGRPIAALYGFYEAETAYFYTQGFDPNHAKLSPGVVMVGAAVETAIRRGLRACDYLRGEEPYKAQWRTREAPTFRRRLRSPLP